MIARPLYLEKIDPFIGAPLAKILTGIRRSGKSTILDAVKERLAEKGIPESKIISAKLDSYEYENIQNGSQLYHMICDKMTEEGTYYLLLDEVQEVTDWEKAVNSLMESKKANVFITGSNSKLMSSEISTYLSGRYVVIPVYTLSFKEYIEFRQSVGEKKDTLAYLNDYIQVGGFPAIGIGSYSRQEAYTIVRDIYTSVIYNDITKRNKIRKLEQFERLVKFMFENIGKTFSAQSICDYMKSEKRTLDIETVYNYVKLLEKAYILYRADRYSIQGKEVMKTQEKYYLADPSLKFAVIGYYDSAVASMLENIVFLELRRRGYDAYIGNLNGKEIDFVGVRREEKIYIQVCRQMPDSENGRAREIGNLEKIRDHYHKYVVTLDPLAVGNENGIEIVHLTDFLLADKW